MNPPHTLADRARFHANTALRRLTNSPGGLFTDDEVHAAVANAFMQGAAFNDDRRQFVAAALTSGCTPAEAIATANQTIALMFGEVSGG